MSAVIIGNKMVGGGHPYYEIAEIDINHNGDIDAAKRLANIAVDAGCDAVKFQWRTVDEVYTAEELAKPRENLFVASNRALRAGARNRRGGTSRDRCLLSRKSDPLKSLVA